MKKLSMAILFTVCSILSAPALTISNMPATSVTSTGATIRAVYSGWPAQWIRCYWGLTDGDTNASAWSYSATNEASGYVNTNYLYSLTRTNTYYYRYSVDPIGEDPIVWSDVSTNFATLMTPGIPTGFPTAILYPVSVDASGTLLFPTNFFDLNNPGGSTVDAGARAAAAVASNLATIAQSGVDILNTNTVTPGQAVALSNVLVASISATSTAIKTFVDQTYINAAGTRKMAADLDFDNLGHVSSILDGTLPTDGASVGQLNNAISTLTTNLNGTNIWAGTVNSNQFDAATKALLGSGTGGQSDIVGVAWANYAGSATDAVARASVSILSTNINGTNIWPGTVNSNQFDSATKALLGVPSSNLWKFVGLVSTSYTIPYQVKHAMPIDTTMIDNFGGYNSASNIVVLKKLGIWRATLDSRCEPFNATAYTRYALINYAPSGSDFITTNRVGSASYGAGNSWLHGSTYINVTNVNAYIKPYFEINDAANGTMGYNAISASHPLAENYFSVEYLGN